MYVDYVMLLGTPKELVQIGSLCRMLVLIGSLCRMLFCACTNALLLIFLVLPVHEEVDRKLQFGSLLHHCERACLQNDFLYLVHGKGSPGVLNSIWPKYP